MHRIVGLDLAGDSVRLVALESGFRGFSIARTAQAPLTRESPPGERLKAALPGLGLAGDSIAVALPGAQVASFPMTLPFTDARRIEQVLPAEIEGAIPFDLDDVVWDYSVLAQRDGKSELLVAVVRKQSLRDALSALAEAGVDPKVVTFAPLALAALGERRLLDGMPAAGGEAPVLAILDAGPDRADFCVLRDGRAELARSLPTAGAAAWEGQDLTRLLGPLVRDLKITLRSLPGKKLPPPARLLLTGAIARLPGAAGMLAAELGFPAVTLQFAPGAQVPEGGASHALALGLALRAQQPRGRLNFRKGEFAFTKDVSQLRGVAARLAALGGLVLLLAVGLGVARLGALNRLTAAYDEALCAATEKILRKCHTDWREALAALRGGNSRAASIPRVSGTEILAEVTRHLPEDALPALEEVDITTTRVLIKGVAEGFGQVDRIISALKRDRCFGEIKQPRVEKQRDSQKVGFAIEFAYTCSGESAGGA